jgi:hypothetical protein
MGADVELARKFGSVDMVDQIGKIRDDYRNLRAGITDEKQLAALARSEKPRTSRIWKPCAICSAAPTPALRSMPTIPALCAR